MDDLAFLRERIESYADYTNDAASVLADEQIRAYVGVALSSIFERLEPAGASGDALARVLLRCQFADQRVVRALDTAEPAVRELAAIRAIDRDLVTLADGAATVAATALVAYLGEIDAALNRRAEIITKGGTALPPAPQR
jgi:hypothetical protein